MRESSIQAYHDIRESGAVGKQCQTILQHDTLGTQAHQYDLAIAREKRAHKRLVILSAKLAEECAVIWHLGDGDGGAVLESVRQAFYRRVGEPKKADPVRTRKVTNTIKKAVFERDAYRCVKCTSHIDLCADHIYPWSLGGSDGVENLQTLCWKCNATKSNTVEVPHV